MSNTHKYITAVIIILSVSLLAVSTALAVVLVCGNERILGSDTVTDNVITPEQSSLSSINYTLDAANDISLEYAVPKLPLEST